LENPLPVSPWEGEKIIRTRPYNPPLSPLLEGGGDPPARPA